MYHSITFTRKDTPSLTANTWDTWRLIPLSRPVIAAPQPKTNFVEVPGASGSLDLSTVLTSYPLYGNRSGSLEFAVSNDFWPWHKMYETLMSFFQGHTLQMTLEDDPDYYYEGIFSVNSWTSKSDGTWSTVKLDYNCQPYKISKRHAYDMYTSSTCQLRYVEPANSTKKIKLTLTVPDMMPVYPDLSIYADNANNGMSIRFINAERNVQLFAQHNATGTAAVDVNDTYLVDEDVWVPAEDMLITNFSGSNTIEFWVSGRGVISIDFKIGRL